MLSIHHDFAGHTTTGQQSTDTIPDVPIDSLTNFDHNTGTLQTQGLRRSRRWRIVTGQLKKIGAIKPGRGDLDANFTCGKSRTCQLLPLKLTFNTLQCVHGASIVS